MLLYTLEEEGVSSSILPNTDNDCSLNIDEDTKRLTLIGSELGLTFISFDKHFSNVEQKLQKNISVSCVFCPLCRPAVLAVDDATLGDKRKQLLSKLIDEDFVPVTFYNIQPLQNVPELNQIETAIFLQRTATFQIIILYPREDNTWWFGDIRSDPLYEAKLASLNLTMEHVGLMKTEGAIERFDVVPSVLTERSQLMFPKDITAFLSDINNSRFIECNQTRATVFHRQFGSDRSPQATRFRHKVWKMLSRVKTVLDSLGLVFWLSSGTVLGYFRECNIIAHSKDVDIGVWARQYTDQIIPEMHDHGFHLKISLGLPNDSLELSFIDQSGIKLDIFFFYEEDSYNWNGGTQVKSGKKFKYSFPKFTLCWTLFKDLRLRVPCKTEAYVRANYGRNWFTPVKAWDWKTSPFNVRPNGQWPTKQLSDAIKLYV